MDKEQVIHWLKTAQWRLARLGNSRRFFKGSALIRYIEVPWFEGMEEAIGWLQDEACLESLFVEGKELEGDWAPLRAWYEDSGSGAQRVWRLYHALRNKAEGDADGPYSVSKGCVWREEDTFYWDVDALPEVPEGTSGVQWHLEGIRRDSETGLFSCVLTKRERVRVDVARWASAQALGETVFTAFALGLREEEGSSVEDKLRAFAQEQGMALEDGDGIVVEVQKSKNDDCTTDVTLRNIVEEEVSKKRESVREDVGARVEREDVANASEPLEAGAFTQGVLESITNERTVGGLYNTSKEVATSKPIAFGAADERSAKTIYEAVAEAEARNQLEKGEEAAEAEGGTLEQVTNRLNSDGTWNIAKQTTQELQVESASETKRGGVLSDVVRVLNRNMPSPLEPGEAEQGVIESVTNEKTPGGLYNTSREVARAKAVSEGEADEACAKTIFEHVHEETGRNAKSVEREAPDAGGGKSYRRTVRLNEDGTFDASLTTTTELARDDAGSRVEAGAIVSGEGKSARNLDTGDVAGFVKGASAMATGAVGVLVSQQQRKTAGGRVDVEVVKQDAWAHLDAFTLATDERGGIEEVFTFSNKSAEEVAELGLKARALSVRKNAFGLFDGGGSAVKVARSRGVQSGRKYKEYEATTEVQDGQLVVLGNHVFKKTVKLTRLEGVLHDNDPTGESETSAFAKVKGCAEARVQNLGNGYWAYSGVTKKVETLEFVKTIPEEPTGFVAEGTWSATSATGSEA